MIGHGVSADLYVVKWVFRNSKEVHGFWFYEWIVVRWCVCWRCCCQSRAAGVADASTFNSADIRRILWSCMTSVCECILFWGRLGRLGLRWCFKHVEECGRWYRTCSNLNRKLECRPFFCDSRCFYYCLCFCCFSSCCVNFFHGSDERSYGNEYDVIRKTNGHV